MIQIVNEWIVKDGVIGTAHKNRHGEMVDFRPVLRKELVLRASNNSLIDAMSGPYAYGMGYLQDIFCSLIPAKGHKLQPHPTSYFQCKPFLLNCLGIEEYVTKIDYPIKGQRTYGYRYMFQFEEVNFFLEKQYAGVEWYDSQLQMEFGDQRQKQDQKNWEDLLKLRELEKEICSFLETFTPVLSDFELNQLRADTIDARTFYTKYVHSVVLDRFHHNSYFWNLENIIFFMKKRVLDQAEARHEERKKAWLAKKK